MLGKSKKIVFGATALLVLLLIVVIMVSIGESPTIHNIVLTIALLLSLVISAILSGELTKGSWKPAGTEGYATVFVWSMICTTALFTLALFIVGSPEGFWGCVVHIVMIFALSAASFLGGVLEWREDLTMTSKKVPESPGLSIVKK